MRLLPDSIRTRTILVLLVGLTVSHLGSIVVYSTDRESALARANEHLYAERVATLAKLIDAAPLPLRQPLTEAVSSDKVQVWWGKEMGSLRGHPEGARWRMVGEALRPYFGEIAPDRLHVTVAPASHDVASQWLSAFHLRHGCPCNLELQVALKLKDASWANFRVQVPGPVSTWPLQSLLSTLVMVSATLLLASWATGWILAPLASFARAAERLGMDVNTPPLPEGGPKEVRAASHAFNQMQQRIMSFVEDRLQMLAAISHDLRTPITRLRLRTEQLPIPGFEQHKMLSDLDELEQMVSASLDFAKDESAEEPSRAIDLAALLGSICDDAVDAGHKAEFEWDSRLVIQGRPLAMKRLFANLVDNATRYGHTARVTAAERQDAIEVVIEDDGPGIPPDQLEKVFKPFYRLDHSRNKGTGGMGLGLATVRSIARAHGGDVTLENPPEGGLRAVVRLPRNGDGKAGA